MKRKLLVEIDCKDGTAEFCGWCSCLDFGNCDEEHLMCRLFEKPIQPSDDGPLRCPECKEAEVIEPTEIRSPSAGDVICDGVVETTLDGETWQSHGLWHPGRRVPFESFYALKVRVRRGPCITTYSIGDRGGLVVEKNELGAFGSGVR